MMDLLFELISAFDSIKLHLRSTELYNENWLLKLGLHEVSTQPDERHLLGFLHRSIWFTEALLLTNLKPRYQDDPLSEPKDQH